MFEYFFAAAIAFGSIPVANTEPNCFLEDGRSVDIENLRISLDTYKNTNGRFVGIRGRRIIVSQTMNQLVNAPIYDMMFMLGADNGTLLSLFHAELDGSDYIYWIDKVPGQLSRNGLVAISEGELREYCEGTIFR